MLRDGEKCPGAREFTREESQAFYSQARGVNRHRKTARAKEPKRSGKMRVGQFGALKV